MDSKERKIKEIVELYQQFELQVVQFRGADNLSRYEEQYSTLAKKLFDKIDVFAETIDKDTKYGKKITLLMAYVRCLYAESFKIFDNLPQDLNKTLYAELVLIIEPYGEQPEGFRIYFWTLLQQVKLLMANKEYQEALSMCLQLKEMYKTYLQNYKADQIWVANNYLSIIGLKSNPLVSCKTLENIELELNYSLFNIYFNIKPLAIDCAIDYGIPCLKFCFELGLTDFLYKCCELAHVMTLGGCYKQTNHILAIAMYRSVLFRRGTSVNTQIIIIDEIQSFLYLEYALWGFTIAERSIQTIRGKEIDEKTRYEPYEELTSLMESEYEQYADHFPIDLVTTEEEVKTILINAKIWLRKHFMLLNETKGEAESNLMKFFEDFQRKYFP